MRVAVSGHTGSGKSTVAEMAGRIILHARSPRSRKGGVPTIPYVAIVNEPGAAAAYLAGGSAQVVRARTLRGTRGALASASGGVAIVDACPVLYLEAVAGWLATANGELDRMGRPSMTTPPSWAWAHINRGYREALLVAGVDIVEVHPAAPLVLRDAAGVVAEEADGYKARGQNQGPISPGLWLRVEGIRSSSRDRRVSVAVDHAGLTVGEVLILPEFRGAKDRLRAYSELRGLLSRSVTALLKAGDEDAVAWDQVDEAADLWPEALEAPASLDRARIVQEISNLWVLHGLSTTAEKSRATRLLLLGEYFHGAVTDDDLMGSPLSELTTGLRDLRAYLDHHHPAYTLETLHG